MTYIDGFVIPVPAADRQRFIDHASLCDAAIMEQGATRILECWHDNVPRGETTDFFGAVDAQPDEVIAFSWIEWPDRAARDAGQRRMEELFRTDERLDPQNNPMPFDGQRMIFGGFTAIVDLGQSAPDSYVQGFIVPVPAAKHEAYRAMASDAWTMFKSYGALRVVECWEDDVPDGKVTDFRRAVKAAPDEKVVFSYIEWPSRAVCDAAQTQMMADPAMAPPEGTEMPFDGKRMVYGGFTPVVRLGE